VIHRLRLRLRQYLLPSGENDDGFRQEIWRQSRFALAVIGGIQIGVSLFLLLARFVTSSAGGALFFRVREGALIVVLGVINLALSRVKAIERWARFICGVSGLITAAILIWSSLLILSQNTNPDDFIPGQIALIMLVGLAIVPLRPVHAFSLGMSLGVVYLGSTMAAQKFLYAGAGPDENYLLFTMMLSLLCTGIAAVVYQQRRDAFELRQAQARMLLAENAESMARLAAALSHELNTPMGALLSGVDTLVLLAAKQATCAPAEQHRLVLLQADVRKSLQQSVTRLKQLVTRMQRFTNLDQAEVQNADLNSLLTDVAALVEPQLPGNVKVELELETIPPVVCKPQQISAVFSNLVQNAVQALDGGGHVRISTRPRENDVQVEIRDDGRGVPPAELHGIFDPGFKVTGPRVRSGNWSMFSSRQIIREHGGDIRITSGLGAGTSVVVTLPVQRPLT
jgi:signal transduction histidine kinase